MKETMQAPEPPSLLGEIMWVLLAMAGGIVRYLDGYLKSGTLPKLGLLFAHAIASGFAGYMVAQVVIKVNTDWALVAAGIGGYMGTQALDWLATVIQKRFGGTPQ